MAIEIGKVTTVGNHSYVSLDLLGLAADNVDAVLGTLKEFEDAHPDLVVTGWQIDKQQAEYPFIPRGLKPQVFGIWIDHRPREVG